MTEQEDPDFRASKYPPNPAEVTYWIDITEDPSGNLIKTYDYTQKKWLYLSWHPLDVETRRAKAKEHALDLLLAKRHVKESEIVDKLGFVWDGGHSDYKQVQLPEVNTNTYFKTGADLMTIIKNADTAINSAITTETHNRTAIDTQHDKKLTELKALYTKLQEQYKLLQTSYTALQKDVSELKSKIQTEPAQASDKQFDDLGLG